MADDATTQASTIGRAAADDDGDDPGDTGVEILDDVVLKSFTARPSEILPFGASVLSWSVSGPTGFRVRLNGSNVARTGERAVQPSATSTYRLSAHARQASLLLGTVNVLVDRSSCITYELANPRSAIEAPVRAGVLARDDLSFRDQGLVVRFSPGRVHLALRLEKEQDKFPNPSVNVDSSFGLFVQDGTLVTRNAVVSVDIKVPFWAWLIPGASIGLAIAIDMARESTQRLMRDTIENLGRLLDFLATPPGGRRLSTVRVDDGNSGAGVIELTACEDDLLRKVAEVSDIATRK
jgi:hypothetical protein